MELMTKRLHIQPFRTDDAPGVYAYMSLPDVTEHAGQAAHKSYDETQAALRQWIADGERHAITLRDSGIVIGHISIEPDSEEGREDTRELGFMLHPDYHRRGFMTEAVTAVIQSLFADGIEYIWACCFKDNNKSKGLIEKCGFRLIQEGEFYSESLDRDFESLEYRISKNDINN